MSNRVHSAKNAATDYNIVPAVAKIVCGSESGNSGKRHSSDGRKVILDMTDIYLVHCMGPLLPPQAYP